MTDAEHEEWLRDREAQQNPQKKHIIVGGLQTDVPEDADRPAPAKAPDADEDDDDDEPESNVASSDDATDA